MTDWWRIRLGSSSIWSIFPSGILLSSGRGISPTLRRSFLVEILRVPRKSLFRRDGDWFFRDRDRILVDVVVYVVEGRGIVAIDVEPPVAHEVFLIENCPHRA